MESWLRFLVDTEPDLGPILALPSNTSLKYLQEIKKKVAKGWGVFSVGPYEEDLMKQENIKQF